ncbi:MAG TPA: ornithine cyclodeaminase family protein [Solirubrobacterales bacterium]|jgi:ornithine cyclodeaminase/alanine dehydrogenase
MTLVLSKADVVEAADMGSIIGELESAMSVEARGGVETIPRVNFKAGENGFFRVMPAVVTGLDVMGLKAFNMTDSGEVRYLVCLWSVEGGELLALLDASELTAIRTGAVTGVAHRAISGGHFDREIGVIGSGLEARTNLEAICAVAEVESVKVFSPRAERRTGFAERMTAQLGIPVVPVRRPEESAGCPTVLVATNTGIGSGVLALEAGWLDGAGHVNAIGSTMPSLREVEAEVFGQSAFVVLDTLDAVEESGDLIDATAKGHLEPEKLRDLSGFFDEAGSAPNDGDQRTIFKSVGTALQDVISAKAIYDVARRRGLGREVDVLGERQVEAALLPGDRN